MKKDSNVVCPDWFISIIHPEIAEAQAFNEALDMACIRRYLSATFEGDAFNVIEAAKNYAKN